MTQICCSINSQEHLFIVCELLRANLYEFQKFNKESGADIYFTLPKLQVCDTGPMLDVSTLVPLPRELILPSSSFR